MPGGGVSQGKDPRCGVLIAHENDVPRPAPSSSRDALGRGLHLE